VRILELSQVWPPSTEVIPHLWAIVRESYKGLVAPTTNAPLTSSLAKPSWPAFISDFGPTTIQTALTLGAPSAWHKDKDYDLFLRVLLVNIYKTGLPAALPASPLLPPLPAAAAHQSPRSPRSHQPFASPLAASSASIVSPPQQRAGAATACSQLHDADQLLPVGRSPAASAIAPPDASFSCYPFVPPTALGLPQSAMKKFTSVIHQSAWVKKLLPVTDQLCLDLLLNIDKDKRSYITLLKDKING
jgi:hypothetical protein